MKKPYKWQQEAISSKKDKEFFMLNCCCGAGKTYTFIELIREHSNAKIIIAPKNICKQWKQELMDEGIDPRKIWVYDQPEASKKPVQYKQQFTNWVAGGGEYLVISTQTFGLGVKGHKVKGVALLPFPVQIYLGFHKRKIFCVLDESSWIKANVAQKKQLSARSVMIQLLGSLVDNRAAGTGTMMSKSPMNLYDQFNFLKPNFFPESRNEFYQKYVITKQYYYSGRTTVTAVNKEEFYDIQSYLRNPNWGLSQYTGKDKDRDSYKLAGLSSKYGIMMHDLLLIAEADRYWPYRNLDELYSRITPYTVTVHRKDIFDISRDKFVYEPIAIPVELTAEQKRLYNKLVKDGFSDEFYLGKAQAAELNIRLQDICIGFEPLKDEEGTVSYREFKENPKLDALRSLLEQIGEEEQVVIWCSRTKAVQSIRDMLIKEDITYTVYTGAESKDEKTLAEEKIKSKEVRVFLGNITAGSFGLNALKDVNYMIWYCTDDSPEKIHQAQHRILRGESKNPKFAYTLLCEKTVEIKQFNSNKNGEEFIKFRNTKEDFLYAED
jgi:superfamily II DNA or RNA helicase